LTEGSFATPQWPAGAPAGFRDTQCYYDDSMISRRRLLGSALTALFALRLLRGEGALAAVPAPPRTPLDEQEAAAKAQAYEDDARSVDPRVFPTYKRGQSCATCALIEFGTARMRGCSLFPGKLVAAGGWCRSWRLRGSKP
jgi:hypothetical protein